MLPAIRSLATTQLKLEEDPRWGLVSVHASRCTAILPANSNKEGERSDHHKTTDWGMTTHKAQRLYSSTLQLWDSGQAVSQKSLDHVSNQENKIPSEATYYAMNTP